VVHQPKQRASLTSIIVIPQNLQLPANTLRSNLRLWYGFWHAPETQVVRIIEVSKWAVAIAASRSSLKVKQLAWKSSSWPESYAVGLKVMQFGTTTSAPHSTHAAHEWLANLQCHTWEHWVTGTSGEHHGRAWRKLHSARQPPCGGAAHSAGHAPELAQQVQAAASLLAELQTLQIPLHIKQQSLKKRKEKTTPFGINLTRSQV